MITYPGPGPLADNINNLDIGNIANETERAKTIEFSSAYCNIQARYWLKISSNLISIYYIFPTLGYIFSSRELQL